MKFLLSFFLFTCLGAYKYDIAICTIFQNDAAYLKEWIEFHKVVGVEHFYLYNNNSADNFREVLKPYIKSGDVDLIEWPYESGTDIHLWNSIQCAAYNDATKRASGRVKWLAALDTDEFLFPAREKKLLPLLKEFDYAAALGVNWQMYGTSSIKCIPAGSLMIELLVMKGETDNPTNVHIKSIVRPERVEKWTNPHYCQPKEGYVQVSENHEVFKGPFAPSVSVDKFRINHYWTRDEHYLYSVKIPRRSNWQHSAENLLREAEGFNTTYDNSIYRFLPSLKKKMKL
jgi:hypothetical protein